MTQRQQGFTIVELLIVIVVIAILATIVTVAYNGVSRSAIESSMQSDLRNVGDTVELLKVDDGVYPASGSGLKSSGDNIISYVSTGDGYCAQITNEKTDTIYYIDNTTLSVREGQCSLLAGPVSGEKITFRNFGLDSGSSARCAITEQNWVACWMMDGMAARTVEAIPQGEVPDGVTFKSVSTSIAFACGIASNDKWYCWWYDSGTNGEVDGPWEMPMGDIPSGETLTAITSNRRYVGIFADNSCLYMADIWNSGEPGGEDCGDAGDSVVGWSIGGSSNDSGYHQCLHTVQFIGCSGANGSGQLGDGTTTTRQWWDDVYMNGALSGKTIAQIDVGRDNTCAVTTDGGLYCWGGNGSENSLGNNSSSPSYSSVPLAVSQGQIPAGMTLQKVSVGGGQACALSTAEWVYCWGWNSYGAVGDNTSTSPRRAPRAVVQGQIPSGVTIKDIAASSDSGTCAIGSDSNLYCWGRHSAGDGTSAPVKYADAYYP